MSLKNLWNLTLETALLGRPAGMETRRHDLLVHDDLLQRSFFFTGVKYETGVGSNQRLF